MIRSTFLFLLITACFYFKAQELYPYRMKSGKFGFANNKFELIIPPQFDYAQCFQGNFAPVRQGTKYGVIDKTAKLIVPYKYDQIDVMDDYLRVRLGNAYGFLNLDGTVITPVKYYSVDGFGDDGICNVFARTSHPDCINRKGKELVPKEYYKLDRVEGHILVENRTTLKQGIIGVEGTFLVAADFDKIEIIDSTFFKMTKGGKITFFPRKPELQKAAEALARLYNEFNVTETYYYDGLISYKILDKMALVNLDLEPLTDEKYHTLKPFKKGLWYFITPNNFLHGVLDKYGKEILPPTYDQLEWYEDAPLIRVRKKDKWGAINDRFETIIPFEYSWIKGAGSVLFVHAQKGNNWFVINNEGKIIGEYDKEPFHRDDLGYYEIWNPSDKSYTRYNLNGELLPDKSKSKLFNTRSNLVLTEEGWRITDKNGKYLNNSIYRDPYTFITPGVFELYLGDLYIYIDEDGNEYYEK